MGRGCRFRAGMCLFVVMGISVHVGARLLFAFVLRRGEAVCAAHGTATVAANEMDVSVVAVRRMEEVVFAVTVEMSEARAAGYRAEV